MILVYTEWKKSRSFINKSPKSQNMGMIIVSEQQVSEQYKVYIQIMRKEYGLEPNDCAPLENVKGILMNGHTGEYLAEHHANKFDLIKSKLGPTDILE